MDEKRVEELLRERARRRVEEGARAGLAGPSGDALRRRLAAGVSAERRRARFRFLAGLGALAAAAAVVITAVVLWWPPPDLQPVLDRIHRFVTADVDRQYEVLFESQDLPIRIEVSLRGTQSFFASVRPQLALGQDLDLDLRQGFDGQEFWVMFPDFTALLFDVLGNRDGADPQARGSAPPVVVSRTSLAACFTDGLPEGFAEMGRGFDRMEVGLQVFQVLEELQRRYTISPADDTVRGRFESTADRAVLIARRHPQTPPSYPESIGLLVDERTGSIDEFFVTYLDDFPGSDGNPFRRIHFKLSSQQFPRPDDFYSHRFHHAPDHPVRYAK
jgi:hypothetical protein